MTAIDLPAPAGTSSSRSRSEDRIRRAVRRERKEGLRLALQLRLAVMVVEQDLPRRRLRVHHVVVSADRDEQGAVVAGDLGHRIHREQAVEEGLAQLDRYLAGLGLETGWLVIFDRRGGQPPIAERTLATRARTPAGREVSVVRA